MLENTHDCEISSELVPVCPVCGETMDVNIRKDAYFVEDEHWYKQDERYGEFLDTTKNNKVLLSSLPWAIVMVNSRLFLCIYCR